MSFLSQVVDGLGDLPEQMSTGLQDLRERDKLTRSELRNVDRDEKALLERLKQVAKQGSEFDEGPFRHEAMVLIQKRQLLVSLLEEQMKKAQNIYDQLDRKIAYFDKCAKSEIPHLMPTMEESTEVPTDQKKKKKKKSSAAVDNVATVAFEESIEAIPTDPNEPTYCFCKRISYGQMIACENIDCPIEWFHFACVGLIIEPPNAWYCFPCSEDAAVADSRGK